MPEKLPQPATLKKAKAAVKPDPKDDKKEAKKPETGLINRTTAAGDHSYWIYVPEDYDPSISHALLIWLHPAGKSKDADIKEFRNTWEDYCAKHHVIVVGPKSGNENGWVAGESDFVQEAVRDVLANYTIDRRRVVAHGMGVGGQMGALPGLPGPRPGSRRGDDRSGIGQHAEGAAWPISRWRSSWWPATRTQWPRPSPRARRS